MKGVANEWVPITLWNYVMGLRECVPHTNQQLLALLSLCLCLLLIKRNIGSDPNVLSRHSLVTWGKLNHELSLNSNIIIKKSIEMIINSQLKFISMDK